MRLAIGGYSGVEKLWRVPSQAHLGITRKIVRRVLSRVEARQLDRPIQTRVVRPITSLAPMAHLQSDLLEITKDESVVNINKNVKYLCVTIDVYSSLILQIAPLKNKRAESVALVLQECIWNFGVPSDKWQTDNGGEMTASLNALALRYGFSVTTSRPYASASNGGVELRNRLIRECLSQFWRHESKEASKSRFYLDRIGPCKYAINQRSGALKLTPHEVFFARKNATQLDKVLQLRRKGLQEKMIISSMKRAGKPKTDVLKTGTMVRVEAHAIAQTRALGAIAVRAQRHKGALR